MTHTLTSPGPIAASGIPLYYLDRPDVVYMVRFGELAPRHAYSPA